MPLALQVRKLHAIAYGKPTPMWPKPPELISDAVYQTGNIAPAHI